ncbi:hypothetical protein [Streptomyces niger]|uniref:hypothetical protein n=1 Tax=Streptomyces niger TaxID=66373 RepID=UPI000A93CDAB|nr:hypothetical protein [Streptomyces niger]
MRGGAVLARGLLLTLVSLLSLLTLLILLTGCQQPSAAGQSPHTGPHAAGSGTPPTGYGAVFLDRGECSSRGRGAAYREVGCADGAAAARVLARHSGRKAQGALCPARTDFVLHISEHRPDADEDGDGSVPRGYACMRNLHAPHPGDPGQGGGPRTVPGDCVYLAAGLQARETPCAASVASRSGARHRPEYEMTATVRDRASCPEGTALYLRLPDRTTGCARRLGPG